MNELRNFVYPRIICGHFVGVNRQVILNSVLRFEKTNKHNMSTVEWHKFNGIDWDKIR